MQKAEKNNFCPCGSEKKYESCCDPFLSKKKDPETAEEMMRSRYSAFVANNIDYIMDTHHPEKLNEIDRDAIQAWSENSIWEGLEVHNVDNGGKSDEEGSVEFTARYIQDGKKHNHHEFSLFKKHDGKWFFYDVQKSQPIKHEEKIGRNDPCPCGSGKKYKKCHGIAA